MAELIGLKFLFQLEEEGKKSVLDWCMKNDLMATSFVCPKCYQLMHLEERKDISDGYHWCCRVTEPSNMHNIKWSMRKGSWFSFSHLPLNTILQMTYLWTTRASINFITDEMHVASQTVMDWNMFCREICVEICIKESEVLGGPGVMVEIFESKFDRRKCKLKKEREKWVFGGIEKGENRCFFKIVEKKSKEILLNVIKENISPETVVMSSCWKTYDCLSDPGFTYLQKEHGIVFKNLQLGALANLPGGVWHSMKRSLRLTNKAAEESDSYLAEYIWRKVHSSDAEGLFKAFLRSVSQIYPVQTN